MDLSAFVNEYFVNPLAHPSSYAPYNLVNTLTFAVVGLLAAYLIFLGLRRLGIKVDEAFFKAVLPFIVLGGIVRVVVDAGILPRDLIVGGVTFYPLVTPGIYFAIFGVFLACFAAAFALRRRFGFHQVLGACGIALSIAFFALLVPLFKNFASIGAVIALALLGLVVFEVVCRLRKEAPSFAARMAVFGQCFDGAATFVGVSFYGYAEQHVLANAVFAAGTPLAFFALKVAFAIIAASMFVKARDEESTYVLLLITVFGLAPGLRDALRVLAGV